MILISMYVILSIPLSFFFFRSYRLLTLFNLLKGTYSKGRTLDLVLSVSIFLACLNLMDMLLTDHKAVVLNVSLQL